MADTIINKFGTMTGWNSILLNLLGRDVEGVGRVSYDDDAPIEQVYGKGRYPIGRSQGNYVANCTIGLYKEEVVALLRSLPPGKRLQDIAPFDITIMYEMPDGTLMKDRIRNAQFTNNGVDVSQGDGTILTEYVMAVSHIDWNVI